MMGHPAILPRFDLLSPESDAARSDAKLKVRLARLQLEAQEKESMRKADYHCKSAGWKSKLKKR